MTSPIKNSHHIVALSRGMCGLLFLKNSEILFPHVSIYPWVDLIAEDDFFNATAHFANTRRYLYP